MVRGNVVKIRLSDDEIGLLDAAVARRGGTRARLARELVADGVRGIVPPPTLDETLSAFGPGGDWRVAAATLEAQHPERWALDCPPEDDVPPGQLA